MPETNNTAYIIAAYVVTWVALIAYAVRLVRTTRHAAGRIAARPDAAGRES